MASTLIQLNRQGYTEREAKLIQLVEEYAEATPAFGKRYLNGMYSLSDIVKILAPQVEILETPVGTPTHDLRQGE